jgi:hypothetical protein
MARFWTSWISGNYRDEGCSIPPFEFWTTGQISRPRYGMTQQQFDKLMRLRDTSIRKFTAYLNKYAKDDCTLCATIDAESEEAVWAIIAKHFPDYKQRFIEPKPDDWATRSDRFKS